MSRLSSYPILAPLLCALSVAAALPAHADQGVDVLQTFTDYTQWTLLGSATASNAVPGNGFKYSLLSLTATGLGDQGGAGWAPDALALDFNQSFSFVFPFFIAAGNVVRGDGLTLVLATAPALGGAGSGLGYEGLDSSVAFAIDTFHFDGDPVSPSLQILSGGSVSPLAATETGLGDSIRDPALQWIASVNYAPSGLSDDAGILTGTIQRPDLGMFSVSTAVNFADAGLAGNPVYWGFTGANGLADDGQFVTSATPVPEPGAAALWLAGLAAVGFVTYRRR